MKGDTFLLGASHSEQARDVPPPPSFPEKEAGAHGCQSSKILGAYWSIPLTLGKGRHYLTPMIEGPGKDIWTLPCIGPEEAAGGGRGGRGGGLQTGVPGEQVTWFFSLPLSSFDCPTSLESQQIPESVSTQALCGQGGV